MAYQLIRLQALPLKAASDIAAYDLVQLDTVINQVKQCASTNVRPFGVVDATALQGKGVAVHSNGDVVQLICGASVGPGQEVAVATRGVASAVQGASALATVAQVGLAAGASGVAVWSVGQSLETGIAGQRFSVLLNPRQISGLV